MKPRHHHQSAGCARRAIGIKAQQRFGPQLLQLQKPRDKRIAAVVAQRAVAQQVRVVQHIAAGPGRKVSDQHRIGADRGVGVVRELEIARALRQRAVLLRCQDEAVYPRTAGQAELEHTTGSQRVVTRAADQAGLCNTVVLPIVAGVSSMVVGHAQAVVARSAAQRERGSPIPNVGPSIDRQAIVAIPTIEHMGFGNLVITIGLQAGTPIGVDVQHVITRPPKQGGGPAATGRQRVIAIAAVQTG